jgi:hypothetical protein
MVRVTFLLDGHETVSVEDLQRCQTDSVEKIMLRVARNHIRRRLDGVSCPWHGQFPHILASGPSADRLTYSVEGCCENFVERATRALEETRRVAWVAPVS